VDERVSKRAALLASLALLFFSALTAIAVLGWLRGNPAPWNWKSLLAVGCAAVATTASALVWSAPSRGYAVVGIVAMLASLARIGPPGEWTWASFALVAGTFVLLMPLVRAAIVLRSD